MAYLTPKTLTCPSCGHSEPLTWITGLPLDRSVPRRHGYVKVHKAGSWTVEKTATETIIRCPMCSTETARRSRTA